MVAAALTRLPAGRARGLKAHALATLSRKRERKLNYRAWNCVLPK